MKIKHCVELFFNNNLMNWYVVTKIKTRRALGLYQNDHGQTNEFTNSIVTLQLQFDF